MAQTPLFANIAELSALSVFTFLSSRFTVVSVPFKVIVPKTNQLTCHSFTGDLYEDPRIWIWDMPSDLMELRIR